METNYGTIVLELNQQKAPKTVENFLGYVRDGFYDETIFHRIIKRFMIQGGGLTLALEKKKVKPPVLNEADNGLKNLRGTIAMARTGDPHSATAQFFINTVDNAFLDHKAKNMKGWGYCVFGKVIEGMNVVDKIENLPTANKGGRQNVPTTPVIIKHAEIEKLKENPKK
ncbi:MAG: peptidylprolyl isomerase [Thermodesulfobacteriota bacterium]|nr:peptidylprolyl isomerase [Thermodesulfobacteriota bacterium]